MSAEPDLPYARPYWDDDDSQALLAALQSGMWTGGAAVAEFEQALTGLTGAPTVAVSSGTAAVFALLSVYPRRGTGSRLLVSPALNFAAGPASAQLLGWDVALCDVREDDLTMCPRRLAELLTGLAGQYQQIVVLAVHYAGHTCDMAALSEVCRAHGADLIEDACHAIGGRYLDGTPVGSWPGSRAAFFSFHPTKPLATAEGGAVSSTDRELLTAIASFRNHNMAPAPASDDDLAPRPYQIGRPGLNLRLSDLHAAVGLAQARRLPESQRLRADLAARYHARLAGRDWLRIVPAERRDGSAHHLFPVVFDLAALGLAKRQLLEAFHGKGIRVQVHYTPLHRLEAFRVPDRLRSSLAVTDSAFPGLVTLPLWRGMTESDQDRVIELVAELPRLAVRQVAQ